MPATVIPVTGMQLGFVGSISNEGYSLRTPRQVKSTDTNAIAFGETLVLNSDNTYSSVKQFVAGSGTPTASTPLGIAVANTTINPTYNSAGSNNVLTPGGNYPPGSICDALVQGTICVYVPYGTPLAGGVVYLRKVLNASFPLGVVGGLEAVADGSNTVALTNLVFKTGYLETDGTVQVTILNRTIA